MIALGVRGALDQCRTFFAGRRAEDVLVFRFRNPETGEVPVPFTRVLSVLEDCSAGPWRKYLGVERCVRVERLVWVEGDLPAFSQFTIAYEHGRHLLKEPIENLHGVSFHRILGRNFNLPILRSAGGRSKAWPTPRWRSSCCRSASSLHLLLHPGDESLCNAGFAGRP